MARDLIKHSHHARRRSRLIMFCTEIKRALFNQCLDNGVPTVNLDFFIEEFFIHLEYHECEYRTETLLEMLLDEGFVRATFDRFREEA